MNNIFIGLPNNDKYNCCFFNAGLQLCRYICLDIFTHIDITNTILLNTEYIHYDFLKCLYEFYTQPNVSIHLFKELYKHIFIISTSLKQYEQEDSCEIIQIITDVLKDAIVEYGKKTQKQKEYVDKAKEYIIVIFNQLLICNNCKKFKICDEQRETMLISYALNVERSPIPFNRIIASALDCHSVNVDDFKCGCDNINKKHVIQMALVNVPKYLLIKIGRVNVMGERVNGIITIATQFTISTPIDLFKRCVNNDDIDNIKYNNYILIGITIHVGNAKNGHYYSYVKNNIIEEDTKWLCCDDMHIQEVGLEQVLMDGQQNGAILLYKQHQV